MNYIQFSVFYRKSIEHTDNPQEDIRSHLTVDSILIRNGEKENALEGTGLPTKQGLGLKSSQAENPFLSETRVHTWRESSVDSSSRFTELGRPWHAYHGDKQWNSYVNILGF